jgi:addiction module HigA family antidote
MAYCSNTKTITKVQAMRMHNPPHPGEILESLCLQPLGLSVTQAAQALGVSRKTLSSILNGRAGISPDMAIWLSMAFGTSAESWLHQQSVHDLWQTTKHAQKPDVRRLQPVREKPDQNPQASH